MRIVAIRARVVRWSIAATGAARGWAARAAVLVEVRGAHGELGLGEAAPLTERTRADDLARELAGLPVPFEVANVDDALAARARGAAQLAIETALLDALGRTRGVAIADLLAAAPASALPIAAVVDSADEAAAAYARGIRTLKLKVYPGELATLASVLGALPPVRFRVDGNRRWPAAQLAALLAHARLAGLEYIEEPCGDLASALDAGPPLALDESLAELAPDVLRRALAHPSVVVAVIKPTVIGGIAATLQLAALARSYGAAPVITHALEGPIGTAACAELARVVMAGPGAYAAGLAAHPALAGWQLRVPQLADDHVHAAGPGLGLGALDLAGALRAAPEPP